MSRPFIFLGLVFAICLSPLNAVADFEDELEVFKSGDYHTAKEEWEKAARSGDIVR